MSLLDCRHPGQIHRRHHITKDGYYRGRKVIEDKQAIVDED